MPKVRINLRGEPFEYIKQLQKAKKDFTVKLSSSSGRIEIGNKVISFGDPWRPRDLGLFSKTQSKLKKRGEVPPMPTGIDYIGINAPEGRSYKVYEDVLALDISAAYNNAAEILGYFDKELIEAHRKSTKKGRLRAFGATAKRSEVFEFKGGEVSLKETETSELRPYFLNAAKYVGDSLRTVQAELGNDFYFFWVDCAFFKATEKNRQKAEALFNSFGFDVHFEKVDLLIYKRHLKHHEIKRVTDNKIKVYNFPIFDNSKKGAFNINTNKNARISKKKD